MKNIITIYMNEEEYKNFKNGTVTGYYIHYHDKIKETEQEEFFNHLGESLGYLARQQKSKKYLKKLNDMLNIQNRCDIMDIMELKRTKIEYEHKLSRAIIDILKEFEEKTDVSVKDLEVNLLDISTMSKKMKDVLVKIELEI